MRQNAIIFDIDGTVVDSPAQKMPSERLVEAFNSKREKYFLCAATGRPWTFAKDIVQALTTDPVIVAGGTQIRTATGEVLWQTAIEHKALIAILNVLKKYKECNLLYNDYEERMYLEADGYSVGQIPLDEPIYFLETIFVPEAETKTLVDELMKIDGITCTIVVAQRQGTKDIHITNEFATKEHAITELLKILQVDIDKTIGVGDGHNDIHLFASVKTKVAMGNAVPELKAAADVIIGGVPDDGLAEYLESIVL